MTAPCRSDCPAGDCAGCAFLPITTRCEPSRFCAAAPHCAHCEPLERCDSVFDGCIGWPADEGRCAMFVDVRGLALRAEILA